MEPPSAEEVQACLQQILDSGALIGAPRSRDFLRYVVTEVLEGRGHRIKESTVARYALNKPGLQPGDPAVRVQATRVRLALQRYYSDQGRLDPVRIELPRGSYVPVFNRAIKTAPRDLPPGILVADFAPAGDPVADSVAESLVHVLGGFPGIRVGGPAAIADPLQSALAYTMRFVLQGSVRSTGGAMRVSARLLDTQEGHVVWSEQYEQDSARFGGFDVEDTLVRQIAGVLGDYRGVALRRGTRDQREIAARQAYYHFVDAGDRESVHAAVNALQSVEAGVDTLPTAMLGHVLSVRAIMRWSADLEADQALAEQQAKLALSIDSGLAVAHLTLATVALSRGQADDCLDHARRAMGLCRWHPTTLYNCGVMLTLAGAWNEGIAVIRQANRLNPLHPWYQCVLPGIDLLLRGEYSEALREVPPSGHPAEERGSLVRALSFAHLGDEERADAEFAVALRAEPRLLDDRCRLVVDEYPDLPADIRAALRTEVLTFVDGCEML